MSNLQSLVVAILAFLVAANIARDGLHQCMHNTTPRGRRIVLFVIALLAFLLHPGIGSAQVAQQRNPNILYIVADDLGWKDVGFHGSDIKTPNIDKLAATGARLEQFYAQPMCTPTRAALMTGRERGTFYFLRDASRVPSNHGALSRKVECPPFCPCCRRRRA